MNCEGNGEEVSEIEQEKCELVFGCILGLSYLKVFFFSYNHKDDVENKKKIKCLYFVSYSPVENKK